MLHVSTSAAHVIMKSQHSQTARSVHFTDGILTHGWGLIFKSKRSKWKPK